MTESFTKRNKQNYPPPLKNPQLTKTSGICHFFMILLLWEFFDQIKNNEYFTCISVKIPYTELYIRKQILGFPTMGSILHLNHFHSFFAKSFLF